MVSAPNRLESLRTLRNANLDGAFANAFSTLVGGTFLVGFVKLLGGSDFWIGLLTGLPSIIGLFQIPGAIYGRSFSTFRGYVAPGGWAWRLFQFPLIALPLVAFSADLKLTALVVCITLASISVMLVGPIYNDWLAELVPPTSRGWFFSRRNALLAGVGTTTGLLGGLILDGMKSQNRPSEGFALVFGLGAVCALISMFYFLRMTDIPRPNPVKQSLSEGLSAFKRPLVDKQFRKVLIFFSAFIFGQAFPGNLFSAYALESIHLPFTVIQLCALSQAVGSIISGPMWGYLADKYGNRPLLMLSGVGIAFTPVCWMFTRPDQLVFNTVVLLVGHIYSGVVWGGVSVCQFNILLATAKSEDRPPYLGVGMATQALIGGIAPLVGAQVMAMARGFMTPFDAYHVIFWSTLGVRACGVFLLLPVREPGATGIRETIMKLRTLTPKGYQALRSLNTSRDPSVREEAIQRVASQGFQMAAEEVEGLLHDPSPKVRRQAAVAIAKLGDPQAVHGLVHQLEEHPDLVEEETLEALGDLGNPDAAPVLIRYLRNPRSSLRRAAAKALGRIGDERAIQPLMQAGADSSDADLQRAALQALRLLGAVEAAPVFIQCLHDDRPSVRIAAAEAVSELEISGAAEALREALRRFESESGSEVAYALGCVGTVEDIQLLLTEALTCHSVITRRRVLLGIARLLGVERRVYPLFMSEGLARDTAVLDLMAAPMKRNQKLRLAVERYSSDNEALALEILSKASRDPILTTMAMQPVEEAFLVAAAYFVEQQGR